MTMTGESPVRYVEGDIFTSILGLRRLILVVKMVQMMRID